MTAIEIIGGIVSLEEEKTQLKNTIQAQSKGIENLQTLYKQVTEALVNILKYEELENYETQEILKTNGITDQRLCEILANEVRKEN